MSLKKSSTEMKENTSFSSKKSSVDGVQSDWICLNCNNLNFSFRKKCNRCKIQSREDNDRSLMSSYHYYNPYYTFEQHEEAEKGITSKIEIDHVKTPRKRKDKSNHHLGTHTDTTCKTQELPSVSPLLKKYKASKDSQKRDLLSRSNRKQLLHQNTIFSNSSWSTFYSPDLQEAQSKECQKTADQQIDNNQLISMLNKMII